MGADGAIGCLKRRLEGSLFLAKFRRFYNR